jgi:hypothetical protein
LPYQGLKQKWAERLPPKQSNPGLLRPISQKHIGSAMTAHFILVNPTPKMIATVAKVINSGCAIAAIIATDPIQAL